MPRKPKFDSGKSITIHAKTPADEDLIKAFKEIHARNNDLEIYSTMMACVRHFLAKHHYPPGNSQCLLFMKPILKKCWKCKDEFPKLNRVEFISGKTARVCDDCLKSYRERRLVTKVGERK